MSNRTWLFEQLEARPKMAGIDGSFASYAAFFRGWHIGGEARWPAAFQRWLADDEGTGWNLGWEALILRRAFPDRSEMWLVSSPRNEEEDRLACRTLFDKLREFDELFPEQE